MATHDISITVRETIWSGGVQQCFHATFQRFPPQYAVEAEQNLGSKQQTLKTVLNCNT